MSRFLGGRPLTTAPSTLTVPAVISSSPAIIRSALVFPRPLVLAIELSFTDATAGSLSGKWVGIRNFRDLVESARFRDTLWHTFLFTVISQAIVVVLAGILAHALARSFRGRWLLRFLVLLP